MAGQTSAAFDGSQAITRRSSPPPKPRSINEVLPVRNGTASINSVLLVGNNAASSTTTELPAQDHALPVERKVSPERRNADVIPSAIDSVAPFLGVEPVVPPAAAAPPSGITPTADPGLVAVKDAVEDSKESKESNSVPEVDDYNDDTKKKAPTTTTTKPGTRRTDSTASPATEQGCSCVIS